MSETDPRRARPEGTLTRFLALPEGLDPRIAALARKVVGDERGPLEAAQKLQRTSPAEYTYTLELDGQEVADPLAHFLFVRKAGHCEYFATALAVMLRTVGIRGRVATGFFGGERVGDEYVVRAGDAHAWTQVLVPGRGFVTVDATPPALPRADPSPQLLESLISLYEALESAWRASVVDYSFRDQAAALRRFFRDDGGAPFRLPSLREHLPRLAIALLLIVVIRRLLRLRPQRGATAMLAAAERALLEASVSHPAGKSWKSWGLACPRPHTPWRRWSPSFAAATWRRGSGSSP